MTEIRLRQVYHPYMLWEDWRRGMYRPPQVPIQPDHIEAARRLLADASACDAAMRRVTGEWKYACEVNLTNQSRNRRAWLGQAACCLVAGASEDITKLAWHRLTDREQHGANLVADIVICDWESWYAGQSQLWGVM